MRVIYWRSLGQAEVSFGSEMGCRQFNGLFSRARNIECDRKTDCSADLVSTNSCGLGVPIGIELCNTLNLWRAAFASSCGPSLFKMRDGTTLAGHSLC